MPCAGLGAKGRAPARRNVSWLLSSMRCSTAPGRAVDHLGGRVQQERVSQKGCGSLVKGGV